MPWSWTSASPGTASRSASTTTAWRDSRRSAAFSRTGTGHHCPPFRVLPGAFRGAYPDARIPLLETVLRELPADCRFLVELKPDPERAGELVRRTLDVIRQAGALARCRFISFDQELLRTLAAELPVQVSNGKLDSDPASGAEVVQGGGRRALGVLAGARELGTLVSRALEVGAEALHAHHSGIDADLVRSAKDGGFLVSAWTVNTPEEVRRLAVLEVAEITTDDPATVLAALGA